MHIAGITPNPDEQWMKQIARNITMADLGFLNEMGCKYLIHDRDSKFCKSFRETIKSAGIKTLRLPARSPNLNSYSERWIRSAKIECLSKFIFFGEQSLRRVISEFIAHYHMERNHQGKNNVLLFPSPGFNSNSKSDSIKRKTRLDGMLNYYYREAA